MAARGRPKKPDDERTSTVRVRKDIAAMLAWIARIRQQDTADVIDPAVRPLVVSQYMNLYPAILAIKQAEDAARSATGQPPTEALPIILGLNAPLHEDAPGEYPTPVQPEQKTRGKKGRAK